MADQTKRYMIDVQEHNGIWYSEEFDTRQEVWDFVTSLDNAQSLTVNGTDISTEEALMAWDAVQRRIDYHKDSNNTPAPAQPEPAPEVVVTDPVTTADGETIMARVTEQLGSGGYLIELLKDNELVPDESEVIYDRPLAITMANMIVSKYIENRNTARDMGFRGATNDAKAQRVAYLRQQIERTESELASLRFELSELE